MSHAVLKRIDNQTHLIYGALFWDGAPLCMTLEEPWRNNQRKTRTQKESCIPEGTYTCRRYHSEKYPDTWQICGVPGRTKILIHTGNTTADTEGCVLLGNWAWGTAIRASKDAFNRFMRATRKVDQFTLEVTVLKPVKGYMVPK